MIKKSEKLNDFSSENNSNFLSTKELLNITNFPKESDIKNNIFEPTILLETIISDLEILEKKVEVMENLVSKTLALGVAIEKNQK